MHGSDDGIAESLGLSSVNAAVGIEAQEEEGAPGAEGTMTLSGDKSGDQDDDLEGVSAGVASASDGSDILSVEYFSAARQKIRSQSDQRRSIAASNQVRSPLRTSRSQLLPEPWGLCDEGGQLLHPLAQ